MQNAIDKLINKIKELDNPTVMGLDPTYDKIPDIIKEKYNKDIKGVCSAIFEFNKALILAVYDIIPAVKINIAFYEMYGLEGMKLFEKTCDFAKEKMMPTSNNTTLVRRFIITFFFFFNEANKTC